MNTIKYYFRSALFLVLLGVVATLTFQHYFSSVHKSQRGASDGPAERVGEVVDRGISGLGKLTERAGKEMQKATDGKERAQVVATRADPNDIHRR